MSEFSREVFDELVIEAQIVRVHYVDDVVGVVTHAPVDRKKQTVVSTSVREGVLHGPRVAAPDLRVAIEEASEALHDGRTHSERVEVVGALGAFHVNDHPVLAGLVGRVRVADVQRLTRRRERQCVARVNAAKSRASPSIGRQDVAELGRAHPKKSMCTFMLRSISITFWNSP